MIRTTCFAVLMMLAAATAPASAQCFVRLQSEIGGVNTGEGDFVRSAAATQTRLYLEVEFFNDPPDGSKIVTYDITNPATPVIIGRSPRQATGFFQFGDTVALGTLLMGAPVFGPDRGNLVVYEMADPDNPVRLGTLDLPGEIRVLERNGNTIYANSNTRLDAISVADPFNPVSLDSIPLQRRSDPIGASMGAPQFDLLPIVDDEGLKLINIFDPANLRISGSAPLQEGQDAPAWVGSAVAVGGATFIEVFDASAPEAPVSISRLNVSSLDFDETEPIAAKGAGRNYFAMGRGVGGNIVNFDLLDPANPVRVNRTSVITFQQVQIDLLQVGTLLIYYSSTGVAIYDTGGCARPPSISVDPVSQATDQGGAPIVLNAVTNLGVVFQWLKDGDEISNDEVYSGVFTETLTIQPSINADGLYTLSVFNADGTETTLPAVVAVRGGTVCPGDADGDGDTDVSDITFVVSNLNCSSD